MPRLDFYADFKLFVKIKLGPGEILIGRAADCLIQLPQERVSRQHAAIRPVGDDSYEIENLSANGTRVNATMLEGPAALGAGDRIYIADYCIIYQPDDTPSEELSARRTILDGSLDAQD